MPTVSSLDNLVDSFVDDVIAVVAPSVQLNEVINCSNVEYCDSKGHLLRNSTDVDNNDDNDNNNFQQGCHCLQP